MVPQDNFLLLSLSLMKMDSQVAASATQKNGMRKIFRRGSFDLNSQLIGIVIGVVLTGTAFAIFGMPLVYQAKDGRIVGNVSSMNDAITQCINKEATKQLPFSTSGTDKDQFGTTITGTPAYYTSWANKCLNGDTKFTGTIVVGSGGVSVGTSNNQTVLGGAQFDAVYGTTVSDVLNTSAGGNYYFVMYGPETAAIYSDVASLGVATALPSAPTTWAAAYKASFDPQSNSSRDLVTNTQTDGGIAGTDSAGTAISTLAGVAGTYTNGSASTAGKHILVVGSGPFQGAY